MYMYANAYQWSACKIIDDIEDIGLKAQTKCEMIGKVGLYHPSKTSKKTKSSNYQLPTYWELISIVVCYQNADKKD